MPTPARIPPHSNFWTRIAAVFGLLCVMSALFAPVSMLAQDVRTGRLGGICTVTASTGDAALGTGVADDGATGGGMQCELCAATALVLQALPVVSIPSFPGNERPSVEIVAFQSAAVAGIRLSRGPPSTLI